jgi:hypothetical protein
MEMGRALRCIGFGCHYRFMGLPRSQLRLSENWPQTACAGTQMWLKLGLRVAKSSRWSSQAVVSCPSISLRKVKDHERAWIIEITENYPVPESRTVAGKARSIAVVNRRNGFKDP